MLMIENIKPPAMLGRSEEDAFPYILDLSVKMWYDYIVLLNKN